MKRLLLASIVALAGFTGVAIAQTGGCATNTRVTGSALTNLVSGNTVCATRGADRWQEQHRTGGQLWDFKKGPSDPIDPTVQVGTWSIAANSITYSYTGGPSFTYSVHGSGPYSFCTAPNGTEVVSGASFLSGSSSCP